MLRVHEKGFPCDDPELCNVQSRLMFPSTPPGSCKLRVGWGMVMFRIEQKDGSQTVDRAWLSLKRFLPCSWTTWPRCIQKVRDEVLLSVDFTEIAISSSQFVGEK